MYTDYKVESYTIFKKKLVLHILINKPFNITSKTR